MNKMNADIIIKKWCEISRGEENNTQTTSYNRQQQCV